MKNKLFENILNENDSMYGKNDYSSYSSSFSLGFTEITLNVVAYYGNRLYLEGYNNNGDIVYRSTKADSRFADIYHLERDVVDGMYSYVRQIVDRKVEIGVRDNLSSVRQKLSDGLAFLDSVSIDEDEIESAVESILSQISK